MTLSTKGCTSESGRLRRVVMCPPANFHIVKPINAVQWMYYRDGLPPPQPWLMVEQHSRVVEVLRQEGVEVELLPPVRGMPFQHATRDIGVVIGDTIVASPRIDIRQQAAGWLGRRSRGRAVRALPPGPQFGGGRRCGRLFVCQK